MFVYVGLQCARLDGNHRANPASVVKFDFTAFRHHPPAGMQVIIANDQCLRLRRKICGRVFTIRKTGNAPVEFTLYAKSIVDGDSSDGSFVMRSDLKRLLFLVGYGSDPRASSRVILEGLPFTK